MDRFGNLRIGLQSFTLRNFDTKEALDFLDDLGLREIEMYRRHLPSEDVAERDRVVALLAERDITLSTVGCLAFGPDKAANRATFEFARAVGVPVISAKPEPESLGLVSDQADEYAIRIAIHNHGPEHPFATIDEIQAALVDAGPRVGLCLDTGHLLRAGDNPLEAMRRLGERVFSIHLKDFKLDGQGARECVIGDGQLELQALLADLLERSFAGPVSIEYEPNPENPVDDLRVAVHRIEEIIRRLPG